VQRMTYNHTQMTAARAWLGAAVVASVGAAVAVALAAGRETPAAAAVAVLCVLMALLLIVIAVARAPQAGLGFEYQVRRRFRAVCREKGLTKKAGDRVLYPPASRLSGNRQGFRLTVRPLVGQALADWERAAAVFTMAYGATGTRVRNEGDGTLTLLVGYQRLDAHEFTAPAVSTGAAMVSTATTEGTNSIPWRDRLARVEVGTAEGGRPYLLPLIGSHVLVAGETGAGKGSLIWSLLLRLVLAHEAGVVRFWGLDPKRMELAIGRSFFGDRYAADPVAMVELLEAAHAEMHRRADHLAGVARRFEPSEAHPLHVLVVDELGYLSALLPDRKLRARAEEALQGVLVLGRAVGFVVVGALQDPRKETLSFRDLFPTRVAMRLQKPMVDLVLGHGMYEAGAQCDLIPPREAGAGVAFVVDESSTLPVCVRMSWCSDDLIRATAARLLPASGGQSVPHLRAVT
jgi:DNA segregation ATPase FtsK/SpoIIIE, S-DNA-T family